MKHDFWIVDGKPMGIARPADPALALRLSRQAAVDDDAAAAGYLVRRADFDEILCRQDYTFAGYATPVSSENGARSWVDIVLGRGRKFPILNAAGTIVNYLQPGDSFITDPRIAWPDALASDPRRQEYERWQREHPAEDERRRMPL